MQLGEEIVISGARETENADKSFVKQPDGCFMLRHHNWQILAIEAGLSETEARLTIDARRWLETKWSETETVITIKVGRNLPHISFKRWQNSKPQRVTRSTRQQAKVVEQVEIHYNHPIAEATGGMVIPFKAISGRGPQNSKEHDIIISKTIFEEVARRV